MNQRYPISFTRKNEYETSDFRFIDVSIDVMHTGSNLNKTSFTKDAINKAIPTIYNTPILGYVVNEDDSEEKDFKGHEHELRITDTDIRYVYAGQAYGVIPESCNPRWIIKDDGTGTEREYLRVDGLIWTKFDDPVDIFSRDGKKNHSVELTDMACGPMNKDGITPVGDFKFDGCCILSTTDPRIQPAMTGSCVIANFSVEDITSQIRERLYEYQSLTQNYTAQNNENPSDEEKGDKTPMTENENKTHGIEENQISTENTGAPTEPAGTETTPSNENAVVETEETPAEENATTTEEDEVAPAENTAHIESESAAGAEFALTTRQLMDEISTKLSEHTHSSSWDPEYMIPDFYFEDLMSDTVVVTESKTWQLMGIPYSMNGDNIVLDYENIKRMKVVYEDWDEGDVLPGMTAAFTAMNDKLVELANSFTKAANEVSEIKPQLKAYQKAEAEAVAAADKAKRDELFSIMDEKLSSNAEYAALKENTEIPYTDLETKCYALVGRQSAEFSYVPNLNNNKTVRFGVGGTQNGSEDKDPYGGLINRYRGNK